jgi:hypothetical protein
MSTRSERFRAEQGDRISSTSEADRTLNQLLP